MNWRGRSAVVAALLAVFLAPAVTAHATAPHLLSGQARPFTMGPHSAGLTLLLLGGVSVLPSIGAILSIARWATMRKTVRELQTLSEPGRTEQAVLFRLVPMPRVSFFTLGVLNPTIFASDTALRQLSDEAFSAAILHEREHVRRRDPMWRFLLAILESSLRPIPGVRRTLSRLALECEFAADQGALTAGARPEHLLDAMVAAAGPVPAHAPGLTTMGIDERLEALVSPAPRAPASATATLGLVVLALAALPVMTHTLFWIGAVCL